MRMPLLLLLMSLLMAGCALSPQQVALSPKIDLPSGAPYARGSVSVTLFDERSNKVIGTRGGAYAKSSTLTLKDDFPRTLAREVERTLQSMGFEVDDQNPLIRFNLYLDRLSYQVPEGTYVSQVDLSAAVRAELLRGNQRFQGRYEAQSQNRVVSAPDEEKNSALINEVVNTALNRLFSDRSLLDFLAGS
ncbi:YajG family lipoprotein [Aestuariirhabdus litorea]|uniref:Lipoprotein n=1 Tax=Aestuariirhabdus litorea TaxID=2528527 RepID=A0A3P3VPV1_9GAMM|nr:YajG family lipoprotein [Aestuariirhabdus litorea]RRJ83696.1 hypothetical protein D0544_00820 [Aestuariirhabdus litorea]RWW96918.1 hypothetical protein DZC74_00820 [Endozoicomonadaceae bacterium GTF-13]